jgi:hypothetical protein
MRTNPKQDQKQWSSEAMMLKLASHLVRDFQDNLENPLFCNELLCAISTGDAPTIREAVPTADMNSDIPAFKAEYQIHSVFKRFRFSKDLYSDDELKELAITSFLDTQSRIRGIDLLSVDSLTTDVLNLARIYVADVLGPYSDEQHRSLCRFGKRASVGIPSRSASEAARWELPLSGSQEQISWFDSEMSQIDCVQDYWNSQRVVDPQRSTYQECSSLALTLVPKTFKSLRAIMPNTTIGSYMSFGLGEIMRKRLKRKGYCLRSLQETHRRLAREASVHQLNTTADLSSASDSISVQLVERLFPADWFRILDQSRIGTVALPNGDLCESLTFCTMGIGYTFPLQTLVFLSLLKAIEAILNNRRINRRTISVYGDDMIYSSTMHPTVVHVFQQIGFVINIDKTFHEGPFRESCGGDYYHGVDVRPFQPRNGAANIGPKAYEAILYKFINGLLMRWSEYEIGRTLAYLCSQVELVAGTLKRVPCDYPDDSGVKCPTLRSWDFLKSVQVAALKSVGHGLFRFPYLRLVPDDREEVRHEPYLWVRLHGCVDYGLYDRDARNPEYTPTFYRDVVDYATRVRELTPLLITREVRPIVTFRSTISGRRLRRTSTFVTVANTGRYMRRTGFSCFETRR